jgi:type I restriction enzyme S subunit
MSELPEGWVTAALASLVEKLRGVSYSRGEALAKHSLGYVPIVRANNIQDDHLVFDELVWVPGSRVKRAQMLRRGDIVVAMSSGSKTVVGKTAQVFEDWEGAFGAFCGVLRPRPELDSKYLGLFLRSRSYRTRISELAAGTNINNLKNEHFGAIDVPLAPLAEQRRIVEKLDKLLARVEASRKRLENIPRILKRFRQSVLAAACSGKLTEDWREEHIDQPSNHRSGNGNEWLGNQIPFTWSVRKLEEISELITKGASPKWQGVSYTNSGVLFVTSENVGWGKLLLDTQKFVERKINEIQPRSVLKNGDVLTNIVGASIGRTAIFELNEEANINQAVSLVRLKREVNRQFIVYVLNSPYTLDHMQKEKVDVARANLSLKDVSGFPIPLPLQPEQKEIVRRVEQLFTLADHIEEKYARANAQVEKLTQSILAKAFRGELVPQDPNDEPASKLLERIASKQVLGRLKNRSGRKNDLDEMRIRRKATREKGIR